ncbi:MAG: helix-turn-helix domain-containing protein [Ruminococcus sp.]|nr:helix-turn-helix domain-containing protein [Ruminococcus sp.]
MSAAERYKPTAAICRSIRSHRERLGIGQKELARRVGVQPNAVSNWETGFSKPNTDLFIPICEALGITLYELFDITDPMLRYSEREKLLLEKYRSLSEGHKYAVDKLVTSLCYVESADKCPDITELTYFSRSLAAGIGDPTDFEDEGEPMYLYSSELVDSADCVFSVNGDSMEPEFSDGDMVLVQRFPDCAELSEGEIGAFIVGNETYVKEYRRDGLHSLNAKYKPMKFGDEERVFFIGRVVGVLDPDDIASDDDVKRYYSLRGQT